MSNSDYQDLLSYYNRGDEQDRLAEGVGRLEFERTIEIIQRRLSSAPARVADIGGGAGRYAVWLADAGYEVEHRDIASIHVEQLYEAIGDRAGINSQVGDARQLDLPDASMAAVLLFGPLYPFAHRPTGSQRSRKRAESSSREEWCSSQRFRDGVCGSTALFDSVSTRLPQRSTM